MAIVEKYEAHIADACGKFAELLRSQFDRIEAMKSQNDFVRYDTLDTIVIGICGGDGIGPVITKASQSVLEHLLADEIKTAKVRIKIIEGLTIERRLACNKSMPDDVLAELKGCHVILKGPTTTPDAGHNSPNLESANVAMRRALDLFANVRPVKIPDQGIDWIFFRENTEGPYVVGTKGFALAEDLWCDFTIATKQGTERIARAAYEYARKNNKKRVSIVTKANVIKTTDGNFLKLCQEMGKEYPEIITDDWYADILAAKLIDQKRRRDFNVFIMPNLYGDILSDEAAEFQGGVGTAGGANLGKRYAMFEAIHGSAPRMMAEGRGQYADPCSMLQATKMLLDHIGYTAKADKLEKALNVCMFTEKKYVMTGRDTGATCEQFSRYVLDTIQKI